MSRHLPIAYPSSDGAPLKRLAITEIMVGPSRHKEISAYSVSALLKQKGYEAVAVSVSPIPFQAT